MTSLQSGMLVLAAVGYLISSACYGAHVLLRQPRLAAGGRFATVFAVLAHTLAIGIHCGITRGTPFTTPADTLSASAWAIALTYLALDFMMRPQPVALGAVAQPIAFLCLFAGAVMHRGLGGVRGSTEALNNPVISLHVVAFLFAYSLLVLAFGCAILYLTQHRMLKKKRSGGLFGKLPPLTSIDRTAFSLVSFAFPLLTIGILAGAVDAFGGGFPHGWLADPKMILSMATWIVYAIYLGLHVIAHWRGPRANYLLIGGLAVALVTYFVPTVVHRFG